MNIEATAEALAPDAVQETITETEAPKDDLGALYDKLNDETTNTEEVQEATPEQPEESPVEAAETVEEVVQAPSDLPKDVRDAWGDMPEGVRDTVAKSHRDFTQKLAEQGRQMHGIKPIQDSLVRAVKELPHMAGMKPEQVADQVFELAQISANFQNKPVETLMGYIEKHGLREQMAQSLAGQPIQNGETVQKLNSTIQQLQSKIAQFEDPEYLRSQVTAVTSEQAITNEVNTFAANAEHWGAVEDHLPHFVALERQMQPQASEKDVLKAAYEAAVSRFVPEAKKASDEAAQAAQTTDPKKTEAAIKAKSVNVKSQPSNKGRVLTQREELASVYDRLQS